MVFRWLRSTKIGHVDIVNKSQLSANLWPVIVSVDCDTSFKTLLFLVGVLGQEWESAELYTHTPYKAFTSHEIQAHVGMRIGLASVNITLKSELKLTQIVFTGGF